MSFIKDSHKRPSVPALGPSYYSPLGIIFKHPRWTSLSSLVQTSHFTDGDTEIPEQG